VITGAAGAACALSIGWWLGLKPEIHTPPPKVEVIATPLPLTTHSLRDSLEAALVHLGIEPRNIRKRTAEENPGRWEWAVDLPASRNLVRTNLKISDAVERWGGRVWEAMEFRSRRTGGTGLRMVLGNSSSVFGRLLLEGSPQAARVEPPDPQVAIVIDDFGYALDSTVQQFIEFPHPITLGILPRAPFSRQVAERARAQGRPAILHLPMEPHGYPREDPGPGAILIEMDEDEIVEVFGENLSSFPGVDGFSNHMGSAATEDPVVMRILLEEASRRGLFFFDSLTTPRSVGTKVAAQCGVPCVTNDLFIDNDPEDLESIKDMIRRLGRRAQARGWAVGVGHPHPRTLEALREVIPELEAEGIRIVPVADLVIVRIARLDNPAGVARMVRRRARHG
jgi:polysaccharide deacetylase 2 family uncharacterized protein YibQ